MEIFIVRHGQCLGQCDPNVTSPDSDLSEFGIQQAQQTGQRLAQMSITHIISSPLVRALATACCIAEESGNLTVQVMPELRELYSGLHRGHSRAELQQRFSCAVFPPSITEDGWDHGGDSYDGVFARAQQVASYLWEAFCPDDKVALVTHGGFANYLLHILLQIPSARPCWFELENCSITRLRLVPQSERNRWPPLYPPVEIEVLSMNDVGHLMSGVR